MRCRSAAGPATGPLYGSRRPGSCHSQPLTGSALELLGPLVRLASLTVFRIFKLCRPGKRAGTERGALGTGRGALRRASLESRYTPTDSWPLLCHCLPWLCRRCNPQCVAVQTRSSFIWTRVSACGQSRQAPAARAPELFFPAMAPTPKRKAQEVSSKEAGASLPRFSVSKTKGVRDTAQVSEREMRAKARSKPASSYVAPGTERDETMRTAAAAAAGCGPGDEMSPHPITPVPAEEEKREAVDFGQDSVLQSFISQAAESG
jgi:hypothetical protein